MNTELHSDKTVWILGVNSAYHESAACLIANGRIVAAAEEERFNRFRHGKLANLVNPDVLPEQAIRYCLNSAGITASDLTAIGFSFSPERRLAFNVTTDEETTPGLAGDRQGEELFYTLLTSVPQKLSDLLGEDVTDRFHWINHHLCHSASAYFVSPFNDAAILSADGIGEATSIWLGRGSGNSMSALREITYPNSLGFLWTKMSRFLGFGPYGQWKVMGMSGYGDPERYYPALRKIVDYGQDGQFVIDNRYLQYRVDKYNGFEELFGPRRDPDADLEDRHNDLAAALQRVTNEAIFSLARYLHAETGSKNLCMAGGVALNCVTNRLIVEEGPFDAVFIQPAANDAGTAIGACFYLWNQALGVPKMVGLTDVYVGPAFPDSLIADALEDEDLVCIRPDDLEAATARLIARGEVVAWFQGRMEFGPRALGNRSILADPRRADIVHYLNDKVKHREYFRPFAASILTEHADKWFDINRETLCDAFMLCARKVRAERLGAIPAVTHVDGTCRLQRVDQSTNPRFHKLITAFESLTGVPALLNTSFNDSEPIICSPQDAITTCRTAGIRYLVMGDSLIDFGVESLRHSTGNESIMFSTSEFGADHAVDGAAICTIERTETELAHEPESPVERLLERRGKSELAAMDHFVKIAFRSR